MKRPSKRFLGCCELKSELSPSGFEYRDAEDEEDEDEDNDESGRSNADELRVEDCDACARAVRAANTA
ncbi:hypothetical protein [Caballeronia sp. KNU42]